MSWLSDLIEGVVGTSPAPVIASGAGNLENTLTALLSSMGKADPTFAGAGPSTPPEFNRPGDPFSGMAGQTSRVPDMNRPGDPFSGISGQNPAWMRAAQVSPGNPFMGFLPGTTGLDIARERYEGPSGAGSADAGSADAGRGPEAGTSQSRRNLNFNPDYPPQGHRWGADDFEEARRRTSRMPDQIDLDETDVEEDEGTDMLPYEVRQLFYQSPDLAADYMLELAGVADGPLADEYRTRATAAAHEWVDSERSLDKPAPTPEDRFKFMWDYLKQMMQEKEMQGGE